MRIGEIERTTKETSIKLRLDLDGSGQSDIDTGIGFLDHMLTLFSRHGMFDFCLLYTSPSPRDRQKSRMPSSA